MTKALSIIPASTDINSGVRSPSSVAEGLRDVLADTYRLTFKTHAYHWNVEGALFFALHNLTEEHDEDLFAAADELAERIRALGQLAPMSMADIMENSVIEDLAEVPSAGDMCADLSRDHERVARRLHALIKLAGEENDPVTEDMATARSAFHEKASWMLKALSAT